MRYSASDAIFGRRKVLKPFELSLGYNAKSGDWICVAQAAMNRDAQNYSNPDNFNLYRFFNIN